MAMRRDEVARPGRDRTVQQTLEAIRKRQEHVEILWLESAPVTRIASALGVSAKTIRRDVEDIKVRLALERLPGLGERIDRAVGVLRHVQQLAWITHDKLRDMPTAQNRVASLKLIAETEDAIARLEGTVAPDALSARVVAAMQETVVATLLEVGGSDLVQAFQAKLRARLQSQSASVVLTGTTVSPRGRVVDALGDDDDNSPDDMSYDEEE
jgi:hypothetical protein